MNITGLGPSVVEKLLLLIWSRMAIFTVCEDDFFRGCYESQLVNCIRQSEHLRKILPRSSLFGLVSVMSAKASQLSFTQHFHSIENLAQADPEEVASIESLGGVTLGESSDLVSCDRGL